MEFRRQLRERPRLRERRGARHLLFAAIVGAGCIAGCSEQAPPTGGEAASSSTSAPAEATDPRPVVVCFGDSLTAGFGDEVGEDRAWPALCQAKADAAGVAVRFQNAGVSGETTSGGLRRLAWNLKGEVAAVVLALGGNDGLRGIDLETVESNLQEMVDQVRARHPDALVVLCGMESPPSMGEHFTTPFRELFPRVADRNDLPLVPFLLDGVGGVPELHLEDGIHPNAAGQKKVAENVWAVLGPLLEST